MLLIARAAIQLNFINAAAGGNVMARATPTTPVARLPAFLFSLSSPPVIMLPKVPPAHKPSAGKGAKPVAQQASMQTPMAATLKSLSKAFSPQCMDSDEKFLLTVIRIKNYAVK
ncbi:MAG: hypothetical protein GC131_06415 [Alphaproteobacteria bacterium]|nr:hypothetical protein [Alphaproteobacteria bacterium]